MSEPTDSPPAPVISLEQRRRRPRQPVLPRLEREGPHLTATPGMVDIAWVASGYRLPQEWEATPEQARQIADMFLAAARDAERLADHLDRRSPLVKWLDRKRALPLAEAIAKRRWLRVDDVLAPTTEAAKTARDEVWAMLLHLHPDPQMRSSWYLSGSDVGYAFDVSASTVLRRARLWAKTHQLEHGRSANDGRTG